MFAGVLLAGCPKSTPGEPAPSASAEVERPTETAASTGEGPAATSGGEASAKPKPRGGGMSKLEATEAEVRASIPPGSADYAHAVALARLHKQGDITFAQLQAAILGMKLPPYSAGDGALLLTPPPPPPGVTFDPKMIPKDWEGTWGVVAQALHLGELTKAQYKKLHRAAHPTCKH